jgi:hypothetical protein
MIQRRIIYTYNKDKTLDTPFEGLEEIYNNFINNYNFYINPLKKAKKHLKSNVS